MTGKRIFRSAVLARIALNEAIRRGRTERYRYQCPKCGWWHLTSHGKPGASNDLARPLTGSPG